MALLFMDGFESGISSTYSTYGSPTISSGGGRTGDALSMSDSPQDAVMLPFVPESGVTYTFGFAIYITAYPVSSGQEFLSLGGGYENALSAGLTAHEDGTFRSRFANSYSANTSQAIALNTWTYMEVEWLKDDPGTVKVWLDGTQVLDHTGDVDYLNQPCGFTLDTSMAYLLDDLYILDDSGTANTSRLGDVTVKHLTPSGHGTHKDGVGSDGNSVDNHLLIDETPADTADYVELQTAGDRDSYTIPNLGVGEVPLAVQALTEVGDSGGLQSIKPSLRIGATDYDGTATTVATAYKQVRETWDINPSTSLAWAEDDLDGAEVGVKREV